jgi:hypothetical protein
MWLRLLPGRSWTEYRSDMIFIAKGITKTAGSSEKEGGQCECEMDLEALVGHTYRRFALMIISLTICAGS